MRGGAVQHVTDAELVRRAGQGDSRAFEELSRRHWEWIVARLCAAGWERQASQDATQEAFAALYINVERIRKPGQVRYWLHTTARRAAIRAITAEQPDDAASSDELVFEGPWEDDGWMAVEAADDRRRLLRVLECLSQRDRTALRLRFIEERSPAETADILGVTEVAERSITMRARQRFMSWYERMPELLPLPLLRRLYCQLRSAGTMADSAAHAVLGLGLAVLAISLGPAVAMRDSPSVVVVGQPESVNVPSSWTAPSETRQVVSDLGDRARSAVEGSGATRTGGATRPREVLTAPVAQIRYHDEPPPDPDLVIGPPIRDEPFVTFYLPDIADPLLLDPIGS